MSHSTWINAQDLLCQRAALRTEVAHLRAENERLRDALVETVNGASRPLPREKYYIPGSILEARVDNTNPLAYGMNDRAMVMYDESPAFRLQPA